MHLLENLHPLETWSLFKNSYYLDRIIFKGIAMRNNVNSFDYNPRINLHLILACKIYQQHMEWERFVLFAAWSRLPIYHHFESEYGLNEYCNKPKMHTMRYCLLLSRCTFTTIIEEYGSRILVVVFLQIFCLKNFIHSYSN